MIRATVDTSILAPSVRRPGFPDSRLAPIIWLWLTGHYDLVISEHILEEIQRTLANTYFSRYLTPEDQAAGVERFRRRATIVPITVRVEGVATHPEDDLILATAVSGQVDYLVTRDRQLLRLGSYRGVTIVSSADFLTILSSETSV